jgi:hypothetical protein
VGARLNVRRDWNWSTKGNRRAANQKKGVPRIHGSHAPWELLFPRSALFLLIILWKTALGVCSILHENEK